MEAVAAESGYLSRKNYDLIDTIGANPHIKSKKNIVIVRSLGSKALKNMLLDYAEKPDDWNNNLPFQIIGVSGFFRPSRESLVISFQTFDETCNEKNS